MSVRAHLGLDRDFLLNTLPLLCNRRVWILHNPSLTAHYCRGTPLDARHVLIVVRMCNEPMEQQETRRRAQPNRKSSVGSRARIFRAHRAPQDSLAPLLVGLAPHHSTDQIQSIQNYSRLAIVHNRIPIDITCVAVRGRGWQPLQQSLRQRSHSILPAWRNRACSGVFSFQPRR